MFNFTTVATTLAANSEKIAAERIEKRQAFLAKTVLLHVTTRGIAAGRPDMRREGIIPATKKDGTPTKRAGARTLEITRKLTVLDMIQEAPEQEQWLKTIHDTKAWDLLATLTLTERIGEEVAPDEADFNLGFSRNTKAEILGERLSRWMGGSQDNSLYVRAVPTLSVQCVPMADIDKISQKAKTYQNAAWFNDFASPSEVNIPDGLVPVRGVVRLKVLNAYTTLNRPVKENGPTEEELDVMAATSSVTSSEYEDAFGDPTKSL